MNVMKELERTIAMFYDDDYKRLTVSAVGGKTTWYR